MVQKEMKEVDFEVWEAIQNEEKRQEEGIELIPSENIVSKAVMQAAGSVLTNKYSEGYPKKRYYAGNEYVDVIEQLAINRAKELFDAEHANVQPHSGANANMAVFITLLNPGDKVLGLKLDHGGHLTHGHPVNISGKLYDFIQYTVTKEGFLDYEEIRKLALEEKPKMIIAGFSAYSRNIDFKKFKEIADEVGALLMADIAHIAGLVAAGLHPKPFPYCDVVTTTTHKTLRGPRGGLILCKEKYKKAIDRAIFPGLQGGPLEHIIAAKAVAFKEALTEEFVDYQKQIVKNSKALATSLMNKGVNIVSKGTDNHLMLIDLREEKVKGKELEEILERVNIYANKNTVPHDPASPFNPSGLRIGTPAITTRGMKEEDMEFIANIIAKAIKTPESLDISKTREEVKEFCKKF
ncbi:MAG: serine hydroxymethyltransferase [Candidatus Woesearchaeota archaeon]